MTEVTSAESREAAEAAREQEWKLPSFGRELFLGSFRLDLISPQPPLDPEMVVRGEAFLARLRAFLETSVDPGRIEREARIPAAVIDGLKALGALGMKVPEAYGGLGLSWLHYNRALSLLGSWHPALSAMLSAHQSVGLAQPLLLFGTEEQRQTWLPRVARDQISAFLLTEPDVGSDPARLRTTAVPTEDGEGYRIDGVKLWATNGTLADVAVVLAKVPRRAGHRGGITAFIVPYHDPGVTVEHANRFMGLRGIDNSQTRLTNVFVPRGNVIGGEGRGLRIALTTLNAGRLSLPGIQVGTAKWATKIAREFASQRVQWGKPVGQHDEVAQMVAFIAASAYGLEAMVDVSCRLAGEERNDIRIEAALTKLYASELCWKVVDALVQVCGGRGYETADSQRERGERPLTVEQVLRDSRIFRIFEGTTQVMHLAVAREAVDRHLQVAGRLIAPDAATGEKARAAARATLFYGRWLPRLEFGRSQVPGAYAEHGRLAPHLRFVERSSRRLARSTFYGMARWQGGLEQRQAFLGRIVDIGAELYGIAAAVVHAETIATEAPDRAGAVAEIADLFCRQASHRALDLFKALWSNDDAAGHAVALQVLAGRHLWLEEGVMDPSDTAPAPRRPGSDGRAPKRADPSPPRAGMQPGIEGRTATGLEGPGS